MQPSLIRNGENGDGSSVWLSEEKLNFYDVDHQIEIFKTKIVREVAATNGTETDVAKIETIDVKNIFDPSERLVAIVYPDTWAGSSEDSASCQLVKQSRKGEKLLALVHRYNSMGQLISLGVAAGKRICLPISRTTRHFAEVVRSFSGTENRPHGRRLRPVGLWRRTDFA